MSGIDLPFNYADWMEHGLCSKLDAHPDAWFPDTTTTANGGWGGIEEQVKAATEVCNQCPVRLQCLAYAIENNERDGIWGGRDFTRRVGKNKSARATATHCANGHRWDEDDNLRMTKRGRRCRSCFREESRRRYAEKKAAA